MFQLICDNDGHWFVIPAKKAQAWDTWCQIGQRNPEDAHGWEPPPYANAVDGPSSVIFATWERKK